MVSCFAGCADQKPLENTALYAKFNTIDDIVNQGFQIYTTTKKINKAF